MILLGMEADRYQTQVVPDLQQRVFDQNVGLAGQVADAFARAQKVIEAGLLPTPEGKP